MIEKDTGEVPTSQGASLGSKISKVAAASAAALLLGELVSLVQTVALARLLSPAQVGFFAAGSVLTSFLGNFVEGGLRSGLIHRKLDLDDAAETVFWATFTMGVLMSLGALASAPLIGLTFHSHQAGLVAASMSGGVLLYALTNVPEALLQRQFSVRRRLIVGPSVSIAFATVSIALAAAGFGVWSMVLGSYASYLVLLVEVWLICKWRPGRGKASVRVWRELARFGFPLVAAMFGDRGQKLAQAAITGRTLGASGLGLLRYGERMARVPVNAMVEVSSNALFPAFARISGDRERTRQAYLRALGILTLGAAAVSAMTLAVGEPLVVIVLGEKWRGAGVALTAMAGLGLGKAFMTVSEEAIKGAGRTKLINWFTLTEVSLSLSLLVALIGPLGLTGVGLSISITALLTSVVVLALTIPVVGVSVREIAGVTLPPVFSALVGAAGVIPLEHLLFHSDTRGVWAGLGLITIDGGVFLLGYSASLMVIAPSTVRGFLASGRALVKRVRSGFKASNAAPTAAHSSSE